MNAAYSDPMIIFFISQKYSPSQQNILVYTYLYIISIISRDIADSVSFFINGTRRSKTKEDQGKIIKT